MSTALGATEAAIQLTFSVFIIGMGIGQLLVGPLTDGLGRRPFLIGGTAAFTIASAACAMAPSVEVLLVARTGQGLAGAACLVTARAVINDLYPAPSAGRKYATVAAFQSLLPVAGPAIGAVVLLFGDWRTIFALITFLGLVLLAGSAFLVPESLPPSARSGVGLRANFRRIRMLLNNRTFMGYVATSSLACAGFFSYIAGAPLVLHAVFDLSPQQYGLFFATNALGTAGSISLLRILMRRYAVERLLVIGLGCAVLAGVVLLAAAVLPNPLLALVWPSLTLLTCSMGFINPGGLILSQRAGAGFAGTAAALHGGIQFTSGAVASPSTGLLGHDSVLPLACVILLAMSAALVSNRLGARGIRRRGESR